MFKTKNQHKEVEREIEFIKNLEFKQATYSTFAQKYNIRWGENLYIESEADHYINEMQL